MHVHSTASDGKLTVEKILSIAKDVNTSVLAFTEHYNMGSYNRARLLAGNDIEIIPAMEISASLSEFNLSKKHVCHIIAYYPSYTICKVIDQYEVSRNICVKKTLKKLQQTISISYNDVLKYARDKQSIGRFDIAIALYKKGLAKSPVSAYGEFLELGTAGYVTREKMQATELIQNIRAAHGVPVLAHPKSLKLSTDATFDLLYHLKSAGLEGIEVYNPHNTLEQRHTFLLFCGYFNLLPTCGSDFHGITTSPVQLATGIDNNLCIDNYGIIEGLKSRHSNIIK